MRQPRTSASKTATPSSPRAARTFTGRVTPRSPELAAEAVAFVNLSGTVSSQGIKEASRLAVYVDTDPGLTQLWLASGQHVARVAGHDVHFTIGENVGRPGCSLPTGGIEWRHTRQPVVLEDWPLHPSAGAERFTTLATLRGAGPHGALEQLGVDPGHKIDELRKVIDLPRRVSVKLELAVRLGQAGPDEVSALEQHGWTVVEGATVAHDPASFREYVRGSDGELSVEKGVFSTTASGWFSDRTTRYLASGKPAVVQDTGFTRSIPAGEGLFAFRTGRGRGRRDRADRGRLRPPQPRRPGAGRAALRLRRRARAASSRPRASGNDERGL